MGFARRTMRFGSGLMLGAAISSALSLLLAPRSGEELRATLVDRREEALRAGEEAELLETERLKRAFRVAVNDASALTGKFDGQSFASLNSPDDAYVKAQVKARKEEQEAEEAAKRARKADEQVKKARADAEAQVRKAEAEAQQARDRAAKESTEAAQARNRANTPPGGRG